ncbi:hypothetical protein HAX54_008680 [Datura stramonium]|uniref:MLO-like protein n=1 Tax=Datura stramonium TaxID=4076 RepID=A0ABS8TDP7_DATST|nr:hypothetical protein [Datura stramonium]
MAGGGGGGSSSSPSRTLLDTPTWALAIVCFIFIFLGIFIEHLIHLLCHWLKKHRKTALFEAMEKLKSVLMQLGFLSLLLAVIQRPISKICIQNRIANHMLPCNRAVDSAKTIKGFEHFLNSSSNFLFSSHQRELTSVENSEDHCASKGMTSFMSQSGINQLNNFIFVLAIMQIVYCVATMALGRAKKCFLRQFFHSVAKIDYLTLRHGFITAHLSSNNAFNFQKYIERSLEDDFKVVVGISPFMWLVVVIFLLVDVHGWNIYLWVSFLPLINAFELAFFIWVTWQFGIKSCYHEHVEIIVVRMGSNFKRTLLEEHIKQAIKQWHTNVKRKKKKQKNKVQQSDAELSEIELSSDHQRMTTIAEFNASAHEIHEISEEPKEPLEVTIVHHNQSQINVDDIVNHS